MGIFDVITLPGLLPAVYRGVPFQVLGADQDVGRRTVLTWFPGLDFPGWDDQGAFDGAMRITGFVVGDDYIAQAEALRLALQLPGPGTLIHPWLGYRQVIVAEPARISFAVAELRVARIDMALTPVVDPLLSIGSTLAGVLGGALGLVDAAATLVTVIGGGVQSVASWSAGCGAATACGAIVVDTCAALGIAIDATPLVAAVATPAGPAAAAALAAAVTGLPAPMSTAVLVPPSPVAVAAGAVAAEAPDARATIAATIAIAAAAQAAEGAGTLAAAVRLAAASAALAAGVRTASAVEWESRDEAAAWRAAIDDALSAVVSGAADLVPAAAGPAAALWRAAQDLQAAVAADLHEIIGRLPPVIRITPARPVSSWLIAQHFAGDDPAAVPGMVADIRRRNRLPHAGRAGAGGPVEVLAS